MIFHFHYGTYSKNTSQDAGKMFGTNVAKPNVEVSMQRHTHIHTHAWFTLLYFKEKIFVVN